MITRICLIVLAIAFASYAKSQDTLKIDIDGAEKLFLKNNLFLLAAQYDIEKQKALEIQAKAYPNPIVTAELNAIDPQNHQYFHIDQSGEKAFTFQQLILLGGKRKAEIELAKQSTAVAEAEFADLLRSLRFQLSQSFYNIQYYQNIINRYKSQVQVLDAIIKAYEVQAEKKNVSLKDVIRLKSIYFKINNEMAESYTLLTEENKNLSILLGQSTQVVPQGTNTAEPSSIPALAELETIALAKRPDLGGEERQKQIAMVNYRLQKRMMIPDVNVYVATDQRGGAFVNQTNVGVSLPLPVWDRNKGNIKAAQWDMKQAEALYNSKVNEVKAEVVQAFNNMQRSLTEYQKAKQIYNSSFDEVFKSVNDNFASRNISILEFVDFFEAYNDAVTEYERIRAQLAKSAAMINFVTASKVY